MKEELRIKTEALRQGKQSIKALDAEIRDLQQEFEDDRTDYLDTIRKQEATIGPKNLGVAIKPQNHPPSIKYLWQIVNRTISSKVNMGCKKFTSAPFIVILFR